MDLDDKLEQDGKEIAEALKEYQSRVTCLTPFTAPMFTAPELDLGIDPELFIGWLWAEGQIEGEDSETQSYAQNVSSMCEWSCLFISMLLYNQKLKGELLIISGNYGFWGHYWMKYTVDGESYFIDLTLQQFLPEAPKLSISRAIEVPEGYNCDYDKGTDFREYVDGKRGFDFYTDPNCF